MFRPAGVAEIIRSQQKDDSLSRSMRTSLADLAQRIAGPRVWIQWMSSLDLAADLTYLLLTTCSDLQTVGEEYVNIIMTDSTMRALPSKWTRLCLSCLQVCAPYLLRSSLDKLKHLLQTSADLPVDPSTRDWLLQMIPTLRSALVGLHRCHLAVFYIHGAFYHLAKRFTGIRYVQYMAKDRSPSTVWPFKLLGYLSLMQLCASFVLNLYYVALALRSQKESTKHMESERFIEADTDGSTVPARDKCPLCLGRRTDSVLTPCGHLYCWSCIHDWCQTKQECPLCRDQFPVNRLIPLQNFDPIQTR